MFTAEIREGLGAEPCARFSIAAGTRPTIKNGRTMFSETYTRDVRVPRSGHFTLYAGDAPVLITSYNIGGPTEVEPGITKTMWFQLNPGEAPVVVQLHIRITSPSVHVVTRLVIHVDDTPRPARPQTDKTRALDI